MKDGGFDHKGNVEIAAYPMVMTDALMKENEERKGLLFPLHYHNLLSKALDYLDSSLTLAILK